jgi:Uma2 family endonuclease
MAMTVFPRDALLRSTDENWTAADWEQLPDDGQRYEIIGGVLYVGTAPSPAHQLILMEIVATLREQVVVPGIGIALTAPVGLFMPGTDPVQPDVIVVRAEDRGIIGPRRIEGVPALLVEVLSPSNANYDLVTKREAYARAGVPEYWIARPVERDILVHSEPEPATGQYLRVERVSPDGTLVSPTLPIRAAVAAFFAGVPADTAP